MALMVDASTGSLSYRMFEDTVDKLVDFLVDSSRAYYSWFSTSFLELTPCLATMIMVPAYGCLQKCKAGHERL